MVIETSAFIAVALTEPGWKELVEKASRTKNVMAAPSWLEASMVLSGRLGDAGRAMENTRTTMRLQIVSFTPEDANLAREAFDRYGKGRHPARLNFGDCMAYALAKRIGEPLLYVGEDFTLTDLA